jgi:hypothetical protein
MIKQNQKNSTIIVEEEKIYANYADYVCIPMTIDKKPAISWKGLIKTPEHKFLPEHNIAILTGKLKIMI